MARWPHASANPHWPGAGHLGMAAELATLAPRHAADQREHATVARDGRIHCELSEVCSDVLHRWRRTASPMSTCAAVERVVGSAAFLARPRIRRDAGRRPARDAAGGTLEASVIGQGAIYETAAYFSPGRSRRIEFIDGECSCPVGYDCKHVAAIRRSPRSTTALGNALPRPRHEHGARVARPDGPPRSTRRSRPSPTTPPRRGCRWRSRCRSTPLPPEPLGPGHEPSSVRPSGQAWANRLGEERRELGCTRLVADATERVPGSTTTHPARARRAAPRDHAHHSRSTDDVSGADPTIDLTAFDGSLWALLHEAQRVGLHSSTPSGTRRDRRLPPRGAAPRRHTCRQRWRPSRSRPVLTIDNSDVDVVAIASFGGARPRHRLHRTSPMSRRTPTPSVGVSSLRSWTRPRRCRCAPCCEATNTSRSPQPTRPSSPKTCGRACVTPRRSCRRMARSTARDLTASLGHRGHVRRTARARSVVVVGLRGRHDHAPRSRR